MRYFIICILVAGAVWIVAVSVPQVHVQISPDARSAAALHALTPESCDIIAKIRQPDPDLEAIPLTVGATDIAYTEMRGIAGRTQPIAMKYPEVQIALRILNRETCATSIKVVTQRGGTLIAPPDLGVSVVTQLNGITWNDWATIYTITKPEHSMVIGVKFPLVRKQGMIRTVTMVTYVPRSEDLPAAPLVRAYQDYLALLASQVSADLRKSGVVSRAYPTMLIVDVPALGPQYAERIALDEHIDTGLFLFDPVQVTTHVAMTIGANLEQYSRYTCSPAKACGIMQFTPGTYDLMVKLYPTAGLIKDFVVGAGDPANAVKATMLLHDYNLSLFRSVLTASQFEAMIADPALTEELLASAFNTGEYRTMTVYKASLAQKAADWAQASVAGTYGHLVAETKGYLAKLRYLRDQWPQESALFLNQISRD